MALSFYTMLAIYYLMPMPAHINTTMLAMGDGTSGPVWRNSVSPNNPFWGPTAATNFPEGEQLNHPVNFIAGGQYVWYWLLATVTGSVAGYNLFNIIGFVTAAFSMFLFIRWLTRNKWIALLAGYVVSFTPYFQVKVGGHPSYGYQALFIAGLWLAIMVLKKEAKKYQYLLGTLLGFCAFWDPYFSLLAALLIGPFIISWCAYDLFNSGKKKELLLSFAKKISLTLLVLIVLLLPLVYTRLHYSAPITNFVGESRNPVLFDAQVFTNRPVEYLMPVESNPFLRHFMGSDYGKTVHHWSNAGEYTVGISLTVIAVIIFGVIAMLWGRVLGSNFWPKELSKSVAKPRHLAIGLVAAAVICLLFSLPPYYGVVKTPTYYFVHLFSMWRAFSRLYVPLNVVITVIFSIILAYFAQSNLRTRTKRIVFGVIALLIFIEYQTYPVLNRPVFSYSNNYPVVKALASRNDVQEIAEYPLDEFPRPLQQIYLVNQFIHKKKILNSAYPGDGELLRRGLGDITDPQTIPALNTLGIDALIVHGVNDFHSVQGVGILDLYTIVAPDGLKYYPITLLKLTGSMQAAQIIVPDKGFQPIPTDAPSQSPVDVFYNMGRNSSLKMFQISSKGMGNVTKGRACFSVSSTNPSGMVFVTTTTGVKSISLSKSPQPVVIDTDTGEIQLHATQDGLRVSDLGCAN